MKSQPKRTNKFRMIPAYLHGQAPQKKKKCDPSSDCCGRNFDVLEEIQQKKDKMPRLKGFDMRDPKRAELVGKFRELQTKEKIWINANCDVDCYCEKGKTKKPCCKPYKCVTLQGKKGELPGHTECHHPDQIGQRKISYSSPTKLIENYDPRKRIS